MTDETERDVKRSLEAHLTQAKAVSRLRHRADRLEEAVREVEDQISRELDLAPGFPGAVRDWLIRLRDRLRSALDSREDEGETPVHRRRVANLVAQLKDEILIGGGFTETAAEVYDEINRELGTLAEPVHADEPEGDEPYICENCGERIGHHTPGSDVEACSTFQPPPPTDEPVSGEGEAAISGPAVKYGIDEPTFLWFKDTPKRGNNVEMVGQIGEPMDVVVDFDAWKAMLESGKLKNRRIRLEFLPTHTDARSDNSTEGDTMSVPTSCRLGLEWNELEGKLCEYQAEIGMEGFDDVDPGRMADLLGDAADMIEVLYRRRLSDAPSGEGERDG